MNRLGINNGCKDIFKHPWFEKIKIDDVIKKKIVPPIKPDVMSFNFDEEEFSKGEIEFRKKLIESAGNGDNIEKLPTVFQDFYYDSN